ncbi:MAG: carboxypeptidase regulatory-like domain-containing protein, partial [Chloroflexi bacterium]|nr:carboxypeptidase regulatory-like domain-containing protein [Chloroflexota bacterium]
MSARPFVPAQRGRRPLILGILALLAIAAALSLPSMGPASAGPLPTPTPKPPEFNAVAKIITDPQDLIEGPMSRGRLGDYLLANSEIQVVIQKPERSLMVVGTFGGQILDADLVRQPGDPERDAFEEWALGINLENTAHYTAVTVINDGSDGQPAVIRATGVDDLLDVINPSSQVAEFGFPAPAAFDDTDLPVEFTTDYILAPNDHFVRVESTVRNIDPVNPVNTFITEFLSGSGLTEPFHPGYGFGEPLLTSACALCNFVAWSGKGEAAGVSYGYIHDIPSSTTFNTNGVTIPLLGESVALALIGLASSNYTIAPNGGEVTVTRYFAVGEDVGSIVDIRNQILGLSTGVIQGTVTRGGLPVAGADVTVLGDPLDGPGTDKNVVSHYLTDASGQYAGTLTPGDYTLQAHVDGHLAATPDPAAVAVTAGNTTVQNFTIPVSGRVRVTVTDETNSAIAAKVSLVGFDPYVDPGNFQDFLGIVDNRTALFGDIFADAPPYGLSQVVFVD